MVAENDTFGLSIECEKTAPYRYYIDNVDDMRRGSIESCMERRGHGSVRTTLAPQGDSREDKKNVE